MAVLITGGTGFIGAEIARQWVAQGVEDIFVLHRRDNFERLQDISGELEFVQGDLADVERMTAVIEQTQPEVIYHLGAVLTGPGEANPQAAIQTNVAGMVGLLEAARLQGVRQVLFASSIGSYGADIQEEMLTDVTLQRPFTIYGISKVFGEQLGAYYKRKYGLDFRGLRYPSFVGPGVKSPFIVLFNSGVIEECAKGNPFTLTVTPETAVPLMYYKDAARAMIELGQAPLEAIQTVNYLVDGVQPTPTAAQLAAEVRRALPGAIIEFKPDEALQQFLNALLKPLDDSCARAEWGWQPAYDQAAIVADFLAELRNHPERYG
jgi:threonine 3-dehydrogenase